MAIRPDDHERAETMEWMIYRLAHEIRTPLSSILSWIRMVKSGRLSPQDMARGLDTMERSAIQQAQLLEDIVEVVTLLTGRKVLDLQDVDLIQVLRTAVQKASGAAAEKNIQISENVEAREAYVQGDPEALREIFDQLFKNAVQYTESAKTIHVHTEIEQPSVKVSIRDEGPGFPPTTLPHILNPLKYSASGGRISGLGAGLLIVQELIKLHDGSLRVESTDSGACFTVLLPLPALKDSVQP